MLTEWQVKTNISKPPRCRHVIKFTQTRSFCAQASYRYVVPGWREGPREGRRHPAAPRTHCALTQDGYQRALRSVARPHILRRCIHLKDDVNLIVWKNMLYQMTGLIRLQDKATIVVLLFSEGRLTSV